MILSFWEFIFDWNCFLCVLFVRKSFRGWEFDEMEEKSTATEKPNSYALKQNISHYYGISFVISVS